MVWLLLGRRAGDNRQIVTLAEAMGFRAEPKQLRFNRASALPNLVLGASLASLTPEARRWLQPPWPAAVIASGRRSVPAACWIRRRSGGRTRLIHIGRPWAPLSWFDLVVTTPQYGLAGRPNVLANLMPLANLQPAATPTEAWPEFADLPRPWTALLVGGDSRPFHLDEVTAIRLGQVASGHAAVAGGSLLVTTGPRTSRAAARALAHAVEPPAYVHIWGSGDNPYRAYLQMADRFIVTGDSASMLADAAATGKPVEVFELPQQPDARIALGRALRAAAERSRVAEILVDGLVDLGLLTSTRDLAAYERELRAARLLEGGPAAADCQRAELARAAARGRALIKGAGRAP